MTAFVDAEVIYAGGSSSTPAREYIVQAGTSDPTARTYVVVYFPNVAVVQTLALGVYSGSLPFNNLASGTSSVQSTDTEFRYTQRVAQLTTQQLGVNSGTANLFTTNLGTCSLGVFSPASVPGTPSTGIVQVASSTTDFKYLLRKFTITALTLSVKGSIDFGSLQASNVQVPSSTLTLLYLLRIFSINAALLNLRSDTTNIFQINLASGIVETRSSITKIGKRYFIKATSSRINVRSSQVRLSNPFIVAQTYSLGVRSSFTELRALPSGYLPGIAPTSRAFSPPTFTINKTSAMAGRIVRRLMCSQPAYATLNLEYENISDSEAQMVIDAYEQSYGTRYGFALPTPILSGSGEDLLGYLELSNSPLKWYYDDKPKLQSVCFGISSLSVSLKARVTA